MCFHRPPRSPDNPNVGLPLVVGRFFHIDSATQSRDGRLSEPPAEFSILSILYRETVSIPAH